MLIDVVSENQNLRMGQQHLSQSLQFVAIVHSACGIGRRIQDQPAGVRADGFGQCLRGQLEARFGAASDNARLATTQLNHFWIADPVRRRNHNFVAFVQGCGQGIEDDLLAAAANQRVLPADVETIFTLVFACDGFSQRTKAGHLGVTSMTIVDCTDGCGTDVLRRIEVRLTRAKRNDRRPFCASRSHAVDDLVGCRRLGSLQATVQRFQAHACSSG
ncbi:hypothetical protein D3C80_1025540 [compost metagenome]